MLTSYTFAREETRAAALDYLRKRGLRFDESDIFVHVKDGDLEVFFKEPEEKRDEE